MLHVMKSFIKAKKKVILLFWTQVYIKTSNFKSIGLPHISIYRTKDRNNLVSLKVLLSLSIPAVSQ